MESDAGISSVRAAKARLRGEIRERIAGTAAGERTRCDREICRRLIELTKVHPVNCVIGYSALADEVRLDVFLTEMSSGGTAVFMPRVHADRMHFCEWTPAALLVRDEKGVLAPQTEPASEFPESGALVVVPGRAYDSRGRRLGRGGGYYDRLLASLAAGVTTVGAAYEAQIVEEVPCEAHDRSVSIVVTERREIRAAREVPAAASR